MEIVSVVAAAAGAFVFGAIWYTLMTDRWMAAAGMQREDVEGRNPAIYAVAFIAAIVVAAMTRHIFVSSGVDSWHAGLTGGLGIGLCLAVPWMVVNYTFAKRPVSLMLVDGVYSTGACAVIGLILGLFA